MIIGKRESRGLEKERIDERHPAAANKEMKCPASFYLMKERLGIEDIIGMGKLTTQQAKEPATNQGDIYAAGNTDLRGISFRDVHKYGTDYATEKSPN